MQTKKSDHESTKHKPYDEDIPVCVCGKPFISKWVQSCYDGSGVRCDECGTQIASTDRVYHCPTDKNNKLHTNGYDLCIPCYKKLSDQVNTDNALFQIWFIINGLNKQLYHSLTSEYQIHTRKALISKSSFEIFQFLKSIDCWNELSDGTTMKQFCDRYDELKAQGSSIKDTSYKYNGKDTRNVQKQVNSNTFSWGASPTSASQYMQYAGSSTKSTQAMNTGNASFSWGASSTIATSNQLDGFFGGGMNSNNNASKAQSTASADDKNIGFSVGSGAKDINTFRLNIENHQMPPIGAISCQGIFNEYYFDTNPLQQNEEQQMAVEHTTDDDAKRNVDLPAFYPSYSCAKTRIPKALLRITTQHNDMIDVDDEDLCDSRFEHYLTVGLNSNIKERDFKRKKLNLCVVLDISGSMSSSFDNSGGFQFGSNSSSENQKSKMRVANECLLLLLTHLHSDDRFGLVLFDTVAEVRIAMDYMKNMKMAQMDAILDIGARGGTNFECGYKEGVNVYKNIPCDESYENRLIFLTDARPNAGRTDSGSLLDLVSRAANQSNGKIYSTFVGIGVDFNANLVSKLVNVRGANQFCVHTNKEFQKKLHEEFDYFVSPMVFNLRLSLFCEGSNGGAIDKVFGSDHVDIQNGEIMKIKTLFPSPPNEAGDVKGGIVLIRLKYDNIMNKLPYFCEVTFEDKFGKVIRNKQNIFLGDSNRNSRELYPNLGVRKGILLVRYVSLIKDWIRNGMKNPLQYKAMFEQFETYFGNEMKYIHDETLQKEIKILNKLLHCTANPYAWDWDIHINCLDISNLVWDVRILPCNGTTKAS